MARLLAALLLAAPLFPAHAVDQTTTQTTATHHKSHKKVAPLVLPPLPSGPLRQIPMDQIPAAAPTVVYENGLLSITAQNATLGEILRDVRKVTGATIDIPQGGAGERVVAQLGPGAPRDVLALLLNGTSFNYVMLGSASDPTAVASVMLTPKPSSGEVQTAASVPAATYEPPQPLVPGRPMIPGPQAFRQQPLLGPAGRTSPAPTVSADDDSDDADADDKDDDSDEAQPVQPGQPAGIQPDANSDQQGTGQPNAGPKTPEQLLQMMQQGRPGAPTGPSNLPPLPFPSPQE